MEIRHIEFQSSNHETTIKGIIYIPDQPKAILHIVHGMQEFKERYEAFAKYLVSNQYLVYVSDHVGHGDSINTKEDFGYFGKNGDWMTLVNDVRQGADQIKAMYSLPYFFLGHSMGSFVVRTYMTLYHDMNGVILSGTSGSDAGVQAGLLAAQSLKKLRGDKHRSTLIDKLAFGNFNKKYDQPRTASDWISRDTHVVDTYLSNEKNTFQFTMNAYSALFSGLKYIFNPKNISKISQDIPILLVSGTDDPVGQYGKGVTQLYHVYKNQGIKDVSIKLYPGGRHEMLNEINKDEVYLDIFNWLERKLKQSS